MVSMPAITLTIYLPFGELEEKNTFTDHFGSPILDYFLRGYKNQNGLR
jgi:hypothetical protein